MKLERILAALIVSACALTTASVSAFASSDDSGSDAGTSADGSVADDTGDSDGEDLIDDEKPAYVYTWEVPASENEESGWVSVNLTRTELIGTLDSDDVDAIVVKGASADDEIGAGFNTTLTGTKAEGYYQTNDDDENWPSNSITINGSAIDWENYYLQLFSNRGEATTVTVSVYKSAPGNDDTSSDSAADNSSDTSSDSSSDTSSDSSVGLVEDSSNTSSSTSTNKNPGTGVAMTFVPAILAGAVVIAAKKRK